MQQKKIHQFALGLLMTIAFGCVQAATDKPTMDDVKKEVAEAAAVIKQYSADQRDQALARAKAVVDNLDAKIDRLKASIAKRWGRMDSSARRKAQTALDDLERRRERTAKSYEALKHSSAGAWEHVKQGFSASYADLREAWLKAVREFDDGK